MKRILSAAVAAAALMAVTGCDGRTEPPTQVSTSDPSAGITSNYTSQSLQAEIVTTTSGKTTEPAVTETSSAETETYTVVTSSQAGIVSQETSSPAVQNPVKTTTTASRISSGGGQAAETTTSSAAVQNPVQTTTTTVTSFVSQTQEPTSRPVPTREEVISAYKAEVSKIIDSMSEETNENVCVLYTLYDMDGNGIPELIIKSGTDEDAYLDTYYVYDEFGIKVVSTGNDGSHAVFACDPAEKRFVSAYSWMGSGMLSWMGFDGSSIDSVKEMAFEYNSEDTFESQMSRCGVERVPFAMYSRSDEELTMVYRVVNGGLESDEITGRDFSFIDNFEF